MDCGPICFRVIAKYYGRNYSLQYLRNLTFITREGVSMLGISDAAEFIGFCTNGVKVSMEQLKKEVPLPCILHWNQNHFVVLYKIKNDKYYIADPTSKKVIFSETEFKRCWISTKTGEQDTDTALLLESGPEFYSAKEEKDARKRGLSFFFCYLTPYKKEFLQLILGMIMVSILQLINALNSWELNHCRVAPIDGKITFTDYWHENQFIQVRENAFAIVSDEHEEQIGKALLPITNSRKVKSGQRVIIRFVNIPDQEFGMVEGVVKTISLVPAEDCFQVEFDLPNGLTTNFWKTLPVMYEMKATAEIVTGNLSLLERFFLPLKKIFKEGFD